MEGSTEGVCIEREETRVGFVCLFLIVKVVSEMGGVIPDAPDVLMKSLPGVGRYTAGMCVHHEARMS